MAKAILEFDLNDNEDRMAHMRCVKSMDMACVIFEIARNLEKKCERICESMEADSDQFDGVYTTFQQIKELFDEHGINVEELIE